jgi:hypothetical protein
MAEPIMHIGGPPVDNVAIDEEGTITLVRLIGYSLALGLGLSFIVAAIGAIDDDGLFCWRRERHGQPEFGLVGQCIGGRHSAHHAFLWSMYWVWLGPYISSTIIAKRWYEHGADQCS